MIERCQQMVVKVVNDHKSDYVKHLTPDWQETEAAGLVLNGGIILQNIYRVDYPYIMSCYTQYLLHSMLCILTCCKVMWLHL